MSNLKSLEDELRAEMSKKYRGSHKAGIEARSSSGLTCRENAGSKASEESSICTFKSTSTSNEISVATNGG